MVYVVEVDVNFEQIVAEKLQGINGLRVLIWIGRSGIPIFPGYLLIETDNFKNIFPVINSIPYIHKLFPDALSEEDIRSYKSIKDKKSFYKAVGLVAATLFP
ncbi:MAG: transcription termination/antitermination protein NusG [Bacillota bacterium]